jgi:hypothetical protein
LGIRAFGKRTCKPNSVPGSLTKSVSRPYCGHSSRRRVAADTHQRPTRRFRRLPEPPCRIGPMRNRRLAHGPGFPPYLVLLRVGFTLPPSLLPERCALTAPFHPYPFQGQPEGHSLKGRYVFCGTSRPRDLKPASRTLSGTLPCGVRTFLPRQPLLAQGLPAATARSSCQCLVYRESGLRSPLRSFAGATFNASAIKIAEHFIAEAFRSRGFP